MTGSKRLYDSLCNVLDNIRDEAPPSLSVYRPPAGNVQGLIQARSRALIHLYLKARHGILGFSEREKQITDGPLDGGIDAFHIDSANKIIYVLQSKFRATAGNFVSANMTVDDLLRMDVSRILKGEKRSEAQQPYNDAIKRLQKAIQQLPDVGSYTTKVMLLGNAKNLTAGQLKKLVEGYQVEQLNHERIYKELLFPVINGTYFSDPNLTIQINLANLKGDTHLDYDVKVQGLKANIKLIFVPTKEVGEIMHKYKNSLLRFNPRSFLELAKNEVNQQIEESIRTSAGNEFALFNNGLTVISDRTSISSDTAKQSTAQVVLMNPQLVNGGQTAYTLSRIFEDCKLKSDFSVFKGKEVLLRVITFVDAVKPQTEQARIALVGAISKASNSQTKIEASDRRSNDEIQIRLQQEFFNRHGLYYERKRGEFADGLRDKYIDEQLLVNRERLVRLSLACAYKANQARASISKFFDEDALASQLKVKDVPRYVYSYEAYSVLEERRRLKPAHKGDRYHTKTYGQALRYGQYAVAAVCTNLGMPKGLLPSDSVEKILGQWQKFEAWLEKLPSNSAYKQASAFDYVNYYKGSTINADLQAYPFSI